MSCVQRELKRIQEMLPSRQCDPRFRELYAAQQALEWALEPNGVKSPFDMIMGTPGDLADCSAALHLLPSSDTFGPVE